MRWIRLVSWESGTSGDRTQRGVVFVSYLLVVGMVGASIVLGLSVPGSSDVSGAGVGLAAFSLFAAAAAVGAGLGFLFGLPRSRFADAALTDEQARNGGTSDPAGTTSAHYLTNSNLIKVSDWLTTIIIGIGLVNLAKIGPAVGDLSNELQDPLGGADYAGIIGVSVIVVALLASIMLCYLWTSIRVRELLEDSETQYERGIPTLEGMTVGEAKKTLGESTLKLDAGGAADTDVIVKQDVSPGSTVPVGAEITVTVQHPAGDPQPAADGGTS